MSYQFLTVERNGPVERVTLNRPDVRNAFNEHVIAELTSWAWSVREQAALVVDRLRRTGTMTFRALCGDSPDTLTTVARFLALLELFREGAVGFDQVTPLGELTVRWTGAGAESDEFHIDEFDDSRAAEPSVADPLVASPPDLPEESDD